MTELRQLYEQWIKALLSGEYAQGRNTLRTGDTFCCLGVLCDLNRSQHIQWIDRGDCLPWRFGDNVITVPPNWLSHEKMKMTGAHIKAVADMNDDGRSFRDIAAYIEQKVMPEALRRVKP